LGFLLLLLVVIPLIGFLDVLILVLVGLVLRLKLLLRFVLFLFTLFVSLLKRLREFPVRVLPPLFVEKGCLEVGFLLLEYPPVVLPLGLLYRLLRLCGRFAAAILATSERAEI